MKLPFNKKLKLDETILITVPSNEIEEKVRKKLVDAQRNSRIKGFRKGKAPLEVVKKIYGNEIRSDVINDSLSHSFYHMVEEKGLKPVGQPVMKPKALIEGKDIKFEATFDVYPEVKLANLSKISYVIYKCDITDKDVDKTVLGLQKKFCEWVIKKGQSSNGDQVKINFTGYIDEEEFEGNSAKEFTLEIGSNSMIPGFEKGLESRSINEVVTLDLTFPEDYHNKDFASKQVKFDVEVLEVLEAKLPEMNNDFFKSVGINVENKNDFYKEVTKRLKDDLKKLLVNKEKDRIFDSLLDLNPLELPQTMITNEINNMREDSARRMGIDSKNIKLEDFPEEAFKVQAKKRVKLGVLLNTIIEDFQLKSDPDKVKKIIEERASMYPEPQQVINWFYSNEEQLKQIEFLSLEEQVFDFLKSKSKSSTEVISYENFIKEK